VLEAGGFRLIRQEGDHLVYTKAGVLRPVVIPKYSSVPVFIIKNNLRTAGFRANATLSCWGNRAFLVGRRKSAVSALRS
jgi:predicted RNA binding protein YcfA (HicA-like mRNA interferase family)